MKKILAVVLAVTLCFGMVPVAFAETTSIPAFTYKVTNNNDGTFTMTVVSPAVTKLTGANLYFRFDPKAVEVVKSETGPATATTTGGDTVDNFSGVWVNGLKEGTDNKYGFGFVSSDGVTKTGAKDMIEITFKVLDPSAKSTTVQMYLDEFKTDDGTANDITSTVLAGSKTVSIDNQAGGETDNTTTTSDGNTTTTGIDLHTFGDLIEKIKELLSSNDKNFDDYINAIKNMIGSGDITDIIGKLVSGDLDIGQGLKDLLKKYNIDYSSFEGILNQVVDFFKGLFGGDSGTTTTVTATDVTNNGGNNNGGNGSASKTGDAGIALAATVCTAAAAAFVLTVRKKHAA